MKQKQINNIHTTAADAVSQMMQTLRITSNDLDWSKKGSNLLVLNTYKQVCERIGITESTCWDAYDGASASNLASMGIETNEGEGKLFTLIVLAINEKDDKEPCFWPEFVFRNNGEVTLEVSVENLVATDQFCAEFVGCHPGTILSFSKAEEIILDLYTKLKKNPKFFKNKYLSEFC